MSEQPVNLLDFNTFEMAKFFEKIDEKPFRAHQLMQWMHQFGVIDFDKMTNLSKSLRSKLSQHCVIQLPEIITEKISADGTRKWLIKLACGNSIETVYIPEKSRGTLCVSSQVGCGLNCSFCSTAKQGFNRNLTTGEIISQIWLAVRQLSENNGVHDKKITNVVFMGMGEPLLNFDNVVRAMDIMMDDLAYGLSKYRVTLSTSGLIHEMQRLSQVSPVSLAVSLHAPNNLLRDELVPVNKKYPLEQLMDVCKNYFPKQSKRCITFEYVMLAGVNDQPEHAHQLVKWMSQLPAKVNLIPFNPFPHTPYQRSSSSAIEKFKTILQAKGIHTITRKTRGDDIDAACGQLAGKVNDRTSRSQRWQKLQFTPIPKDVS